MSIRDKGVKRLYVEDETKGVPPESVEKLQSMLAFIDAMDDEQELVTIPSWNAHQLKRKSKGHVEPHCNGKLPVDVQRG